MKQNLKQLTNLELFELYAGIMTELRQRDTVHSSNNPIANYAEKLAARALSLAVMVESTKGYDATDQDGRRYEIKGRRPTVENKSRQLSMIRELDKKHFDFLIGVIFHENFIVFKACIIPYEVVMQRAKYRKHSNAWIFQLKDKVWEILGVRDVTQQFREAQMIEPGNESYSNHQQTTMGMGQMIKQLSDNVVCSREWTGNDRVNRHHFGRVRLNESPLDLRLYWKNDDNSPRRLIGAYRIDLKTLLRDGYIREAEGHPDEVILRFQRTDDGEIQIAINRQGYALTL